MSDKLPISIVDVEAAALQIEGQIVRTPLRKSITLS